MHEIQSPLRYPGGKTRAIKKILSIIPHTFSEFREPFVGGGSVFLAIKQYISDHIPFCINDLNYDLFCFWKYAQEKNASLYEAVLNVKKTKTNGRELFKYYTNSAVWTDFERAVRFFVLNRITFSGTVDSGGYSEKAFTGRFTDSSVERIKPLQTMLHGISILNKSYEDIIFKNGNNVFIFCDPPYYRQAKSRLYGKNGILHTTFNHEKFAQDMKKCRHTWLITLDNTVQLPLGQAQWLVNSYTG
ncbi:MAG: DNA adenine methylase [Treponema sp.]|jgi:DNA adenine methylase|nr:DNA adenine methylase [Treponema sp.]